ncbi:DJ-1/PfpI family protein [Nocardia noduli]|uniref:DJ-1/PfpI family protein n=1 Tax=Nocardia noduli TaxID=2815722 RepID=UPI001C242812|nr:DJ-1/PfpI family protein [Nocardia noduli]
MSRPTTRAVAFLVANDGIEEIELVHPWRAVTTAGFHAVLLAPFSGYVETYRHLDRVGRHPVNMTIADARAADYDAVVLPGGVANPDILRRDSSAHRFLREANANGAPIAAICHGPWTLIDAALVAGRTVAAWPSLATDLTNAGATWTPDHTHVDGTMITAQSDQDVAEFTTLLLNALGSPA